MALQIFALIVIGVIIAVTIWLVVLLGSLPGKIARARGHPQTDAIQALGWVGLITLGIAWFIALVWAYTRPGGLGEHDPRLAERINVLEGRLQELEGAGGES